MKKIFRLFGIFVLLILLVSGCGASNVVSENGLIDMLVENYPDSIHRVLPYAAPKGVSKIGQDEVFEVDALKIIRRQTNKDDKTDTVDCKIEVHNDNYEGYFYYTLYLNYYDQGGWQLDEYISNGSDELKPKRDTVPYSRIEYAISRFSNLFGNYELVRDTFDDATGIVTKEYLFNNKQKYLTTKGTVILNFEYDSEQCKWEYTPTNNVVQTWDLVGDWKFHLKDHEFEAFQGEITVTETTPEYVKLIFKNAYYRAPGYLDLTQFIKNKEIVIDLKADGKEYIDYTVNFNTLENKTVKIKLDPEKGIIYNDDYVFEKVSG